MEDYEALKSNGAYTLIPQILDDNIINMKWIFSVKERKDLMFTIVVTHDSNLLKIDISNDLPQGKLDGRIIIM